MPRISLGTLQDVDVGIDEEIIVLSVNDDWEGYVALAELKPDEARQLAVHLMQVAA